MGEEMQKVKGIVELERRQRRHTVDDAQKARVAAFHKGELELLMRGNAALRSEFERWCWQVRPL